MGRVARYKKIKDFDPYSAKNKGRAIDYNKIGVWGLGDNGRKPKKRSRTAEKLHQQKIKKRRKNEDDAESRKFDLPPSTKDEFDLKDLVGSLKKEKVPTLEDISKPAVITNMLTIEAASKIEKPDNAAAKPDKLHEREEAKLMKQLETQVKEKQQQEKQKFVMERLPGESKNAYSRRVKQESRQIMKQTRNSHDSERKQRKKEFLKNKKKKKKKGGNRANDDFDQSDSDNDDAEVLDTSKNDGFITGEQALAARARMTAPAFGEQAERPPVFKQLPRGARKSEPMSEKKKESLKRKLGMSQEEIEAEQHAMDLIRRKAQAQYEAIKSKRKRAGDFHL